MNATSQESFDQINLLLSPGRALQSAIVAISKSEELLARRHRIGNQTYSIAQMSDGEL